MAETGGVGESESDNQKKREIRSNVTPAGLRVLFPSSSPLGPTRKESSVMALWIENALLSPAILSLTMLTFADPSTTSLSSYEQLMASRPHLPVDPLPILSLDTFCLLLSALKRPTRLSPPPKLFFFSLSLTFLSFSSPLSPYYPRFFLACSGRAMTEVSAQDLHSCLSRAPTVQSYRDLVTLDYEREREHRREAAVIASGCTPLYVSDPGLMKLKAWQFDSVPLCTHAAEGHATYAVDAIWKVCLTATAESHATLDW
ncbi:hypothetical protein Q8A73_017506 [Channa argus]|nr:hypothetical protein Q8A73_017506 [Channa argus]